MHPNCHSVLHSIPDAVISLDKDGYILYVNPATASLFNFSEKELVGQPFHLLYQNDGIKSEYELEQARKKREFSGYGWRQKREGGRFWAEYRICAIYEQRELAGYTCLLSDASGKKKGRAGTVETGGALSADGGCGKGLCHFSSGRQRPY